MRGPNSALYGRTAIGGAVNVRTGEPTAAKRAGLDLTGGDFDYAKGAARGSGPVGDWGGYFVSASSERNTGFYSGPSDFEVDQTSIFGKLTFVADAKSFGKVSVNRVRSAQSLPTNEPIIGGRFLSEIDPRFDRLSDLNVAGVNYRQKEDRLTANYTRQFTEEVRLVNVAGFRQIQYKFIDSGDITGAPFDLAANTRGAGDALGGSFAGVPVRERGSVREPLRRLQDREFRRGCGPDGQPPADRADRILNGGIEFAPADAWKVRVDVKHVGDVMVDQGNTFELDPYTLLDAAVSWWLNDRIRFTLSAHNLLDEEYYWNGDTSRAESADPGAPRQVLLGASFSFR